MPGGVALHRSMTLKQRITLGLAAFLLALAAQIFLSFYQSGTVLRELMTRWQVQRHQPLSGWGGAEPDRPERLPLGIWGTRTSC